MSKRTRLQASGKPHVSPGHGIGGGAISKAAQPRAPRTTLNGLRKFDIFSVRCGLRSGFECPHSGPGA